MSYQVQFEDPSVGSTNSYESKKPKMVQFLIDNSNGIIKDENQANVALIILVLIIIILSAAIFLMSGPNEVPVLPPSST